jgi:hypothetical protein
VSVQNKKGQYLPVVHIALLLAIHQSYGLAVEAVQEPVGVGLAIWKLREQFTAWVAGVFNNFPGLPLTPPG